MNKLYLFLTLLGFVNVAIFVVGIRILQEFKDFKEISSMYKQIYDLDQKLYKSILSEIKNLENIYDDHKSIMDRMAKHYDHITEQYKKIGEIIDGYRKLCNDKLNKICTPNEPLKDNFFYEIVPTNDNPNGGVL
jgi:predicted nuclease with TOPRIM domain